MSRFSQPTSTKGQVAKIGAPEPIAALNRVRIVEKRKPFQEREPLVDIRQHCPEVVLTASVCPYLRHTVADMLNRAQSALPAGYRFRVGTALRTLSMQKRGWDNYFQRMREEHPEWPLSALRRATNKYFAPYDQPAPPGHCTGGAVDVELLDPQGNVLDLIEPTQGWEAAYTWSDLISPEAKKNRMLLVEAMLGAGFSNCRDEYWHYSWGDSAWAVRVGEKSCPYGWVHPSVALEADATEGRPEALSITTFRDETGLPQYAEGTCTLAADSSLLRVGIFWGKDIPLSLRITGIGKLSEDIPLFLGDGKEEWKPFANGKREGDVLLLEIVPDADRVYLISRLTPSGAEGESAH